MTDFFLFVGEMSYKLWIFSLFGLVSSQQPPWCKHCIFIGSGLIRCLCYVVRRKNWLAGFGHDVWRFPSWIQAQMDGCSCRLVEPSPNVSLANNIKCFVRESKEPVPSLGANDYVPLSFCAGKQWLLQRMPPFDVLN